MKWAGSMSEMVPAKVVQLAEMMEKGQQHLSF